MKIFVLTFFISTFFISTIFILVYLIWNDLSDLSTLSDLFPFLKRYENYLALIVEKLKKLKEFFIKDPEINDSEITRWGACSDYLYNMYYDVDVTDDIDEDELLKDELLSAIEGFLFYQNASFACPYLDRIFIWTFINDSFVVEKIQELLLKSPKLYSLGMRRDRLIDMVSDIETSASTGIVERRRRWFYDQNRVDNFLKSISLLLNRSSLWWTSSFNKGIDYSEIEVWSSKISKTKDFMPVEDFIESLFRKRLLKDLGMVLFLSVSISILLTLSITNGGYYIYEIWKNVKSLWGGWLK